MHRKRMVRFDLLHYDNPWSENLLRKLLPNGSDVMPATLTFFVPRDSITDGVELLKRLSDRSGRTPLIKSFYEKGALVFYTHADKARLHRSITKSMIYVLVRKDLPPDILHRLDKRE